MTDDNSRSPKSIDRLTGALVIWLWLAMIVEACVSAAYVWRTQLAWERPGDFVSMVEPLRDDSLDLLAAGGGQVLLLVILLICGFLTLKWVHRAARNTQAFVRGAEVRPHWVIWWWFIPLAAFIMPYRSMSEAWRGAQDPDGWKRLKDPALLRLWWGLYLVQAAVGIATGAWGESYRLASEVAEGSAFTAAFYALQLVSTVPFLMVIRTISRRQTVLIARGHTPAETSAPIWES